MLKRLILLCLIASPAYGAGTIPFSLSQQFDSLGKPLSGCKLYTIVAGTTSTPQNAYQDSTLTLALPNPQTCDSAGRLPQMFVADGTIKIRLTSSAGVVQVSADNVQVTGASSGSGGGGTVDPTTVLQTGHMELFYGTGTLTGFVRCNGRTIGNATSGATERANADTSALYAYLWGADANLSVSTGRGASAAADYAANKTIALPDCRGRTVAGMDDMGSTAAGRLTATYFGTAATALGAAGGSESKALLTANLPAYTPAGTVATTTASAIGANAQLQVPAQSGSTVAVGGVSAGGSFQQPATFTSASTFTGTAQGGVSTPVAVVSPMILATIYLKL